MPSLVICPHWVAAARCPPRSCVRKADLCFTSPERTCWSFWTTIQGSVCSLWTDGLWSDQWRGTRTDAHTQDTSSVLMHRQRLAFHRTRSDRRRALHSTRTRTCTDTCTDAHTGTATLHIIVRSFEYLNIADYSLIFVIAIQLFVHDWPLILIVTRLIMHMMMFSFVQYNYFYALLFERSNSRTPKLATQSLRYM